MEPVTAAHAKWQALPEIPLNPEKYAYVLLNASRRVKLSPAGSVCRSSTPPRSRRRPDRGATIGSSEGTAGFVPASCAPEGIGQGPGRRLLRPPHPG